MRKILFIALCLNLGFAAHAQNSEPAKKKINLFDLGYTTAPDSKPNFDTQLNLEKRRFYLNQHQKWGLVTLGLLALSLGTGQEGNPPIEHVMLGTATAVTYGVTAYYGIAAPTWSDRSTNPPSGGSALHRNLAWIHLPGMILTPILGYMAKKKGEKNEELNSPEKYHKDVAGLTAATLAISVLAVSFDF